MWVGRALYCDGVSQGHQSPKVQIIVNFLKHQDIRGRVGNHLHHRVDLFIFATQNVAQQEARPLAIKFDVKCGDTDVFGACRECNQPKGDQKCAQARCNPSASAFA